MKNTEHVRCAVDKEVFIFCILILNEFTQSGFSRKLVKTLFMWDDENLFKCLIISALLDLRSSLNLKKELWMIKQNILKVFQIF